MKSEPSYSPSRSTGKLTLVQVLSTALSTEIYRLVQVHRAVQN